MIDPAPDAPSDDALVSLNDAADIGFKIVEMCDRVRVGNKHTPGAVASWVLEIDGVRYDVKVTVSK